MEWAQDEGGGSEASEEANGAASLLTSTNALSSTALSKDGQSLHPTPLSQTWQRTCTSCIAGLRQASMCL